MGKMIGATESAARKALYCAPSPVYQAVARMYLGYGLPHDVYAYRARRLQALLATPSPLNHLLRRMTVNANHKLSEAARTEEQRYTALALMAAVEDGRMGEAAGIAEHCSRRADTRVVRAVSDKRRFVYFGTPRVASCSISEGLRRLDPEVRLIYGLPLDVFCDRYSLEIRDYFTFGFIRHPLERLWACWQDKVVRGRVYGLERRTDFPSFCEWIASPWGSDIFADRHWLSQHRFLTRPDSEPLDFMGRCESIDDDWRTVLERIGLPHRDLHHSHRSRPQKPDESPSLLDPQLLARLRERYAGDFDMGNYGAG